MKKRYLYWVCVLSLMLVAACTEFENNGEIVPPVQAIVDRFTNVDGYAGITTPSVLANDLFKNQPATAEEVTVVPGTLTNPPAEGGVSMSADGSITVQPGTPGGTYVLPYTICDKGNPGNCASTNATVLVDFDYQYSSNKPYNLNVVYFVTSDRQPNAGWHERLSKVMLHVQDFYGDWMQHWGYGNKTFGLLTDEQYGMVKIHLVEGAGPASDYPYDYTTGGAQQASDEVEAYFDANPDEKSSDHTLIIFAVNEDVESGEAMAVGPPFYGWGRSAFALDYPGMGVEKFAAGGLAAYYATTWIGGLAHELGHGLNLPHCGQTVSQKADLAFGTSLMGSGNSTYGTAPTFLTHSSAAVLNNCQVFADAEGTFYGGATEDVTYDIMYNGTTQTIDVTGSFTSSVPVTDITYFHHHKATDGQGYKAVTWVNKPDGNTFSISMPISEFPVKGNEAYEFSVILNQENQDIGSYQTKTSPWFNSDYEFVNNIPVFCIGSDVDTQPTAVTFNLTTGLTYAFGSYANGSVAGTVYVEACTGVRVISIPNLYRLAEGDTGENGGTTPHIFVDHTAVIRINPDNTVTYKRIRVLSNYYIGSVNYGTWDVLQKSAASYDPATETLTIPVNGNLNGYGTYERGSGTDKLVLTSGEIPQ